MSSAELESKIEAKFRAFCLSEGITCKKLKGDIGWPDRTLLYRGQVMFMELKRQGAKPTPLQVFCLEWLQGQGFTAEWSDNLVEMKSLVMNWKRHVDNK